jgi:Rrf2 family protein
MFSVSTRVRYGMRALVSLAQSEGDKPIKLGEIAQDQALSLKYLENIFRLLRKEGIVRASRGPEGGYRLQADPKKLTIYQIIKALEGPLATVDCVESPSACDSGSCCDSRDFWCDFQEHMEGYLKTKTLDYLIQNKMIGKVV